MIGRIFNIIVLGGRGSMHSVATDLKLSVCNAKANSNSISTIIEKKNVKF